MDIITNHTADVIQLEGNAGYRNKTDFPYLDASGQPFDDADYAYYGQDPLHLPHRRPEQLPIHADYPGGRGDRQKSGLVE